MKRITTLILICGLGLMAKGQFVTNLSVSTQPPGTLISWGLKDLRYLVVNQTGASRQAVIKTTFKLSDGTVIGSTNLAKARVINIAGGNNIFEAPDVFQLDAMVFTGKYKTSIDKTGKLPADNYQLCVQMVTPTDFQRLSEEICRPFNLAAYQLPIPVMPLNDDVLDAQKAQTAITFRWTPLAPRPAQQVKYIVKVFEVLERQTPMQALRSNQPLVSREVIGTTQFIWQPQLAFMQNGGDAGHLVSTADSIAATRYIWTIQTTDLQDVPFGDGNVNGDGISEPNVFTIIRDKRKDKSGMPARQYYLEHRNQ